MSRRRVVRRRQSLTAQWAPRAAAESRMPMPKLSAGILLYRWREGRWQVLLVHPGGPFWAQKDRGAWSLPKGEYQPDEDPLEAARRELAEETGAVAAAEAQALGTLRQPGGKQVTAWAVAGDFDPTTLISNAFELEWPPRSGRRQSFPEVDRAAWFDLEAAREKLLPGQLEFLDRLRQRLAQS